MAARIRVGTCSWADESLVKYWYPKGVRSGEERLRFYADHFDTVEANSTYYRLPDEEMVAKWAERIPDGFVMHVKAFGMMTRHPVKPDVLPPDLRDAAPVDEKGRIDRPSRELRAEVFARFHAEELGATHVIVDAPKTAAKNLVPTVVALTSPTAYVRMHGRNAKTWNIRGRSAAERFDYLYSHEELREWAEPVQTLAEEAEEAYVMFNNNGRSRDPHDPGRWISQAPTNAAMFRRALQEEGAPA
jgi:uncharacterized protein YecE (DUF72 family)